MKVVFLVASAADSFCGVYDYTEKLAAALGGDATIERFDRWNLSEALRLRRKYLRVKDVVFHLQYPSTGLGKSLTPGFLPLILYPHRVVVTLHEFSIFNPLRKAMFLIYGLLNNAVFTNDYERHQFRHFFGFRKTDWPVIPIGNNITAGVLPASRTPRIVYFGQITTGKGLEEFIATIKLLRGFEINAPAAIMGAMIDKGPFEQQVKKAADDHGIALYLDKSAAEVSSLLADSTIALLPFPDGISDKRGSALACLEHGLCVVTRHTDKTPDWMRRTTYGIESPEAATSVVKALLEKPFQPAPDILDPELELRRWPAVAAAHRRLYKK